MKSLTKRQQRVKRDNEKYDPTRVWKVTTPRLKKQIAARIKRTGTMITMPKHLDDLARLGDKHFL
jgi:hypothetical protein